MGKQTDASWADIVFAEPHEKQKLEAIIHPLVRAERDWLKQQVATDPAVRFIVMDTPLLFEAGFAEDCDTVVFVDADRNTRLERVRADRDWDENELDRREKNQWPLDRKLDLSDHIVDNNNGEAEAVVQIRELITRILETS